MKFKILLSIIFIIACCFFIYFIYIYEKNKIDNLKSKLYEKQVLIDEYKDQKSILIKNSKFLPAILEKIKFQNSNQKFMIICIPDGACWMCVEDYIRKLEKMGLKYGFINRILCTKSMLRNLNALIQKEKFDIEIYEITETEELNVIFNGKSELFFIIYEPKNNFYFQYIEKSIENPLEFLINNFYENK